MSFNDGAAWQPLTLNLPVTPVHGIVVEERDLVIGTHGRGFYVLDNIGVLRQATPELTTNDLFVFETFNPLRGRDRNVTFDYYLGQDAEEVKIEFLDAQGSVLRSFSGTPKPDRDRTARRRRSRDGRVLRHGAGPGRRGEGHEPLHVGHALRGRHGVSRA